MISENEIAQQILTTNPGFKMHDFFDMYTRQVIAHNHEYQELKYLEHKLQERFDILQEQE